MLQKTEKEMISFNQKEGTMKSNIPRTQHNFWHTVVPLKSKKRRKHKSAGRRRKEGGNDVALRGTTLSPLIIPCQSSCVREGFSVNNGEWRWIWTLSFCKLQQEARSLRGRFELESTFACKLRTLAVRLEAMNILCDRAGLQGEWGEVWNLSICNVDYQCSS